MRTNIDTAQYKKDFLNYADKDGFIREGIFNDFESIKLQGLIRMLH